MRTGVRAIGWSIGAAALLALAGCDLGPDYHRPALDIPPAYRASAATAATAWPSADWWRGFRSPELDSLIAQARRENFDLLAAIARVQQADAQVRIAGAALLPTLGASGSASWVQESNANYGRTVRASSNNIDVHDYSAGLNASYTLDFWGKTLALAPGGGGERHVQPVRPADRGADRGDQRRQHLVQRARCSPTSLRWRGSNLADSEQTLAVIRGRMEAGTASALDVAQQEALVAGVRATIPNLRSQMEQQIIGLGILVGRPPEAVTVRPGTLTTLVAAERRARPAVGVAATPPGCGQRRGAAHRRRIST